MKRPVPARSASGAPPFARPARATSRLPRRATLALALALALVALLCAAAACSPSSSSARPTAQPTVTGTPTPTAVPQVVYTADWSHGADGWTLPPHWSVRDGQLVNDGGGTDPIPVPYTFTGASYAVKMHVVILTIPPASCLSLYGYRALDAAGATLYDAEINCFGTRSSPRYCVSALSAHGTNEFVTADHIVSSTGVNYTVLVRGKRVTFLPGETALGSVTADVPLLPARLTIIDMHVNIAITSFQITTA